MHFFLIEVLFIIIDTPLDLQSAHDDMKMQPRWELQNMQREGIFWNLDRGQFDFNESEYTMDADVYMLMQDIAKRLGEELIEHKISSLEVRPVYAVRT